MKASQKPVDARRQKSAVRTTAGRSYAKPSVRKGPRLTDVAAVQVGSNVT